MAKKNDKTWIIILVIGIILILGARQGWFKSVTNFSLIGNSENQNPLILPPPQNPELECYQKAAQLNALYYINPVTTSQECLDFAILDCQDVGKVIDGYGVSGTCCYYTCVIPSQESTCVDSDGGQDDQQFIKGTVTDGDYTYVDECDWGNGGITEYYCDNGVAKMMNWQCTDYWTCQDGKCAQQLCEDIMNPTPEKCASGYTTDGGVCEYWAIDGGVCLSSFQ